MSKANGKPSSETRIVRCAVYTRKSTEENLQQEFNTLDAQRESGEAYFTLFDHAFDAAARNAIKIKATLTANSGPWHIGTPMMLHSHTGFLFESQRDPMRRYVRKCVSRYARHPALGQWILWNEPCEPGSRGDAALAFWRTWLAARYEHNISTLNTRWLTGFTTFDEIPFPEEIAHPKHRRSHWLSYRPSLDDWKCRAAWLVAQLNWIKAIVRELDPVTPTCVNPPGNLGNLAASGTDLAAMAAGVEVLGASFHPAWHFTFTDRHDYPALIAAGVRQLLGTSGKHRVEVTEVQTGNTTESSIRSNAVTPGEIARFHLAALAAGAETVTGWCFNVRQQDNEAGDWALLDDADAPSPRSRMLRHTADRYHAALERTGPWHPAPPTAIVLSCPDSQAIEMIAGRDGYMSNPGRRGNDGPEAAALLAVNLMRLGVCTTIAKPADAPALAGLGCLIVASHLTSWDLSHIRAILGRVRHGATLLLDGVSGRRDHDAQLHQPWPGGLSTELGLESAGLETNHHGWPWQLSGLPAGNSVLTRLVLKTLSPDWSLWPEARFLDGEPAILERAFGNGRVVLFRGMLGASRAADPLAPTGIESLLRRLMPPNAAPLAAVAGSPFAITIPIATPTGQTVLALAPDRPARAGQHLRLRPTRPVSSPWLDLWTGHTLTPDLTGELTLPAEDGVAILWNPARP
jgi:hypothetical protein